VTQAGHVVVASLITDSTKLTLHPGDTVKVTAAPLGPNGESLVDRKVTWQSLRPDIASVDRFGLVTAHAAGTTEILAASESQSARIGVTVAARVVTYSSGQLALSGGTDRFTSAIGTHDIRQLSASMAVESPDDQKNLDWFVARFRDPDANIKIARTQGARATIRDAEATMDIVFTFTWHSPNGDKQTKAKFRARATKGAEGWTAATLKALDKLE
jgi:uncharacterized protein YjdB